MSHHRAILVFNQQAFVSNNCLLTLDTSWATFLAVLCRNLTLHFSLIYLYVT